MSSRLQTVALGLCGELTRMALVRGPSAAAMRSKSGKPCPRLTAPVSVAKADITVKMVVPTAGSLVRTAGVRTARVSELIVVDVATHGLGDQVPVQPVGQQFGELEDEVAQV